MHPPSYYTSLANSNSANNRNSSHQLRSTFSASPSAAYVSRTHLPFVSQSMLVAHCITGAGSTTKPYGRSSYYSATQTYSPTTYSRPPKTTPTKRHQTNPYLAGSSFSSTTPAYLARPSYLSQTGRAGVGSSRRPSISSLYKPIRLRTRPLLAQISRHVNTGAADTATRLHSSAAAAAAPVVAVGERAEIEREKPADPVGEARGEHQDEQTWSADVSRNISRNKYLIKFRERQAPAKSSGEQEVREEEPAGGKAEGAADFEESESVCPPVVVGQSETADGAMKIPVAEEPPELQVEKTNKVLATKQADSGRDEVQRREVCDIGEALGGEREMRAPREGKNIKLKIKKVNASSKDPKAVADAGSESRAAPAKQQTNKKASPKQSPEIKSSDTPTKTTKATKLATKSSKNANASMEKETKQPSERKSELIMGEDRRIEQSDDPNQCQKAKLDDKRVLADRTENEQNLANQVAEAQESNKQPIESSGLNKRIRFREYKFEDFNFLSVLGHGGWGFVILAELKEHEACFAVKCIKKITIVEDDDFDSIMIERKVLTLGNIHPFICKLFCTFETEGYLFFVMEYCAGGDLMFHVQREGKFSESRCRFYAAEIICAIRFLHNRHIIYRDLKLDNILLDSRGHIRLVDFGMCQCRTYREEMLPSNFCGTPEYISPEIIKGVPYNHSVDWWSFGVLLYEMAVGKMPFRGNDENELLWNVCYEQIHYPMFLTKELASLLQSLLEREPTKRMGMSTCKAGDICNQAWFAGVDWVAIGEMRVQPPFVPEVTSRRDVRNFDSDFTESAPELSPVDESTLQRIDQDQFQRFPYTNPNIFHFD